MSPIKLLLSDVDGTLVTSDKWLTPSTVEAVGRLRDAGITFAITSGRSPRGTGMLVGPLGITTPIAACNGACVVTPELENLLVQELDADVVGSMLELMAEHGLSPWVYRVSDWYVLDRNGPHVDSEIKACQYEPEEVTSFEGFTDGVTKIVGVSDDTDAIAQGMKEATGSFGDRATVTSSQSYYLDVTHINANKGWVLRYMATTLGIDPSEIATIGDGQNDISMFELSGLSIAIDGHNEEAREKADHVTSSNDDDGFARAVDEFVLSAN